jgi:hypothetical protein
MGVAFARAFGTTPARLRSALVGGAPPKHM